MSVIHTSKKPPIDVRSLFFPVVCGSMLLVIFFRLWYFQIVLAPELIDQATLSQGPTVSTLAPRGLIFDRTGKLVAGIRPQLLVTAIPSLVYKNPEVLKKVAEILGVPEEQLLKKMPKKRLDWKFDKAPRLIFAGPSVEAGSRIAEAGDRLPGIGIDSQPMRYYPDPINFGHILGNVWTPDQKDEARFDKYPEDVPKFVGKFGVEWFYERQLMGQAGTEEVELDSRKRPLKLVGIEKPIPGSRMILTIDSNLQKLVTEKLAGQLGAVVVLQPKTGEILAMASSPALDLKKFENGISAEDYRSLIEDQERPYFNRAAGGTYAPGSTFKIVTSLAAFETGKLDAARRIYCDGAYHFENKKTIVRCEAFHGSIQYKQAFERSCNTYFCTLGREVGEEAISKAAHELGLGEPTGIDLRTDAAGVIPTPDWKDARKRGKWVPGDTVNMSIGQGDVLTTPVQMADLAAMVANRGVMYQPHLVKGFKSPQSDAVQYVEPVVKSRVDVSTEFWNLLQEAMIGVVSDPRSTGGGAQIPGLLIAGKTGSAEHGAKIEGKTHAWFIGYAPADDPQIAFAVLVESAGQGGREAAPVAREIIRAYFDGLKASASAASAAKNSSPARVALSTPAVSPNSR